MSIGKRTSQRRLLIGIIVASLIATAVGIPTCGSPCAECPADDAEADAAEDIAALQDLGEQEGWTFSLGENDATTYPLELLCGLVEPENWWEDADFHSFTPQDDLPSSFDWRDYDGCTPIRNQGGCGSCWAFATIGPLECNIKIKDGVSVDLSEQWLVSCNFDGWGCGGGWWAHKYFKSKVSKCGGPGAVYEEDFPYVASQVPCDCPVPPYPHDYVIDSWAYIGNDHGVPSVESIKQAILEYGPVSSAIYTNWAFHGYDGGVFNACYNGQVNHGVVIVGWDDNPPDGEPDCPGVWIIRNSWGTNWGEEGYMRIEYGCSRIGYAACYVDYPGADDNRENSCISIGNIELATSNTIQTEIRNTCAQYIHDLRWEITMYQVSPLGEFIQARPFLYYVLGGHVLQGKTTTKITSLSLEETQTIYSEPIVGFGHIDVHVLVFIDDDLVAYATEDGFLLGRQLVLKYPRE